MNSSGIAALVGLNALFLAAGIGIVTACRGFATLTELLRMLGVAYMAGYAAVTLLMTELLSAGINIGVGATVAAALALLVGGGVLAKLLGRPLPLTLGRPEGRESWLDLVGIVPAVLTSLALLAAVRVGFGQGLIEWDAWTFWVPKAMSIYQFGHLDLTYFVSAGAPTYPLVSPTLDALAFHFMGTTDGVTLHTQFGFLAFGFAFAAVGLLRPATPRLLVWPFIGLLALAGSFRYFVVTPFGDLPLDYALGLGVLCLVLWLADRAPWKITLATLFFATAICTKREGTLFVVAALVPALVLTARTWRSRWPSLVVCTALAWLSGLPFRQWYTSRGLIDGPSPTSISQLIHDANRILPSARITLALLFDTQRWLIIVPLGVATLVAALLVPAARQLALYYGGTVLLLFIGLVWVLWSLPGFPIDTTDQTPIPRAAGSIVFVTVLLAPLLLQQVLRARRAPEAADA